MPRYDYNDCSKCGEPSHERVVPMDKRLSQRCKKCYKPLTPSVSSPALHGFDKLGRSIK